MAKSRIWIRNLVAGQKVRHTLSVRGDFEGLPADEIWIVTVPDNTGDLVHPQAGPARRDEGENGCWEATAYIGMAESFVDAGREYAVIPVSAPRAASEVFRAYLQSAASGQHGYTGLSLPGGAVAYREAAVVVIRDDRTTRKLSVVINLAQGLVLLEGTELLTSRAKEQYELLLRLASLHAEDARGGLPVEQYRWLSGDKSNDRLKTTVLRIRERARTVVAEKAIELGQDDLIETARSRDTRYRINPVQVELTWVPEAV